MSSSSDREALWVDGDSEVEMDTQVDDGSFEITVETEMDGTASPSYQKRRNTWPGSLLTAKVLKASEELDDTEGEKSATNTEEPSSSARKMSTRRNAWGNMSYAEMITSAIESTPEKRMTLAQIYDWIVKNVPYFQDKGDNSSSAGWKNSVRHNLSLHSQFSKLQNEGTGKSSWWVVNPEAAIQRRRARTMESGVFDRKRGKGRLKMLGSTPATISTIDESQSEPPGTRGRSGSCASSLGRLSPIQAEPESALDEWNQLVLAPGVQGAATHCLAPGGSKGSAAPEPSVAQLSAAGNVWQNFTITLKDSVTAAPVPTTVLFVDQPVSAAMLPNDRGTVSQQAPMIVLLTSPQTAMSQYIQSSSGCVAMPSSLPSNAIPRVSLSGVHAVRNVSDASAAAANQPKQSSLRTFLRNSGSSAAIQNDPAPSGESPETAPSSSSSSIPESRSVSQHYLQFLKLLSSKQMREYMKLKPGFSEKFRKLLLAKREKMLQEMNGQQRDERKSVACQSIYGGAARLLKAGAQPVVTKPNRMQLEESMNLISLNSENSTARPLPCGSKTQPGNFSSGFDAKVQQQQVEALDLDFEQVVNHELEHDLLLDFNFDSLANDMGCDDDFLSQF